MQLFGTKGQKLLRCSGTKGQRDKLKILPRDGAGQAGTAKFWTERAGIAKIRDGTWDKRGRENPTLITDGRNSSESTGHNVGWSYIDEVIEVVFLPQIVATP